MGTKGIKGDYTGFTFNGVHIKDLGITRVSGGDRYNMDLLPNFEDKVVDVPGGDGAYYFGSLYKNREFSFNLAYDGVTEQNLRQMQQLFGDRRVHPLILDEYPFKTYYVRINGTPNFEYIAFDDGDPEYEAHIWTYESVQSIGNTTPERIYKGEATIDFVCYEPWAHCIHKFLDDEFYYNEDSDEDSDYYNYDLKQWAVASGLKNTQGTFDQYLSGKIQVYNPGDRPAPFTLTFTGNVSAGTITDGTNSISFSAMTLRGPDSNKDTHIVYDSKLHLIYGKNSGGKTGTVYNDCITAGDFFDISQTDPILESNGLTLTVPQSCTIEYDYLYF